jgi:hypothetical protein
MQAANSSRRELLHPSRENLKRLTRVSLSPPSVPSAKQGWIDHKPFEKQERNKKQFDPEKPMRNP